ncbi:MAG: hypothetical protein E7047_09595 [Lentisphaerae bacterium]|nr:hypothetical protein [Lentisphaerota bacterium]
MSIKFDLLEKFRRALFRSDGVSEGARDASEADYLVKMNIPPLLGRRDAACEFLRDLLKHELKEMPLEGRLECYRCMLEVLEYAIIDTESVQMTLASAETAGREKRLHSFLSVMRDLLSSACAMAEASVEFSCENPDLGYFLNKSGRLARYAASGRDAEMRSLNLALDLSVAATARFQVYCDYNRKSFSAANSERYQAAFDLYSSRYRKTYSLKIESGKEFA